MSHRNFPAGAGLSLILAAASPLVPAVDPAYMAAVTAEVEEFSTGSFDLPPGSPWVATAKSSSGANAARGDAGELEEFDAFLHKKMPGTYIQYRKLPYSTKKQIHAEYVRTGDLNKTKKSILDTIGK